MNDTKYDKETLLQCNNNNGNRLLKMGNIYIHKNPPM